MTSADEVIVMGDVTLEIDVAEISVFADNDVGVCQRGFHLRQRPQAVNREYLVGVGCHRSVFIIRLRFVVSFVYFHRARERG